MRGLLALLVAANVLFFVWAQGWLVSVLPPLPLPPSLAGREPERLQRQVRPESITVLSPKAVATAASEPGEGAAPDSVPPASAVSAASDNGTAASAAVPASASR